MAPSLLHITVASKLAVTLPEATFTGWPLPAPVPPENVMERQPPLPLQNHTGRPMDLEIWGGLVREPFGALTVLATALLPSILQMSRCCLS